MKIVRPMAMTDAALDEATVTEDDYAEWDQSTSYDIGDRVISTTTHKIYQSTTNANLDNDPTTDAAGVNWLTVSATNRWKAFDGKLADRTQDSTTILYRIRPTSIITVVALFELQATDVTITVFDDSEPKVKIFESDVEMIDLTPVFDWFTFFTFNPYVYDTEALFASVPGYIGYEVVITISGSGTVGVGEIVLGYAHELGEALNGAQIGIADYSVKDRDDFGNAVLVERSFSQTADIPFMFPTNDARRIQRILSDLRAQPCVFYTDGEQPELGTIIYGHWKDWSITLQQPARSFASIEIEGLV